jgi:four helix bundle protein
MTTNIIEDKSYRFALNTIKVFRELSSNNEYVLSKQLLRSGTSIGANVVEGLRAQSRKDFISKMNIALKEANETEYWIRLLIDSGYLDAKTHQNLLVDCKELCRILNSIVKTARDNLSNEVNEELEIYGFEFNCEL